MARLTSIIKPWIELTRVEKYTGFMLLFWPFAWSLTLNARATDMALSSYFPVLFYGFLWVLILRSAGCIWNDIIDRKLDRLVERTKQRPLADGRIMVPGALAFLFVHVIFLLKMLSNVDELTWNIGLLGIFPLPGMYPLMKRITHWPQAWLGFAMNVGVPLAWSLSKASATTPTMLLGSVCWAWTIYYDTIYACQDIKDDREAGINSTALLFGSNIKRILSIFASIVVCALGFIGILSNSRAPYFLISVLGSTIHFIWQLHILQPGNPTSCGYLFRENGRFFGFLVWSGFFFEYVFAWC